MQGLLNAWEFVDMTASYIGPIVLYIIISTEINYLHCYKFHEG